GSLIDHLVRPLEQRLGNRQSERLRDLHVDNQVELRGLLDRQASGLRALENLVDEERRAPMHQLTIGSVEQERPGIRVLSESPYRRKAMSERETCGHASALQRVCSITRNTR